MTRPGPALLVTPNPEELRGRPGPARDAALAAAETDPHRAHEHILDAASAAIAAGEARLALRLLDRFDDGLHGEAVRRRARAWRAWAQQVDGNLYPGWAGGELADDAVETMTTVPAATARDAETMLAEAYAAYGPAPLFSLRQLLETMRRTAAQAATELLPQALSKLQDLAAVGERLGLPSTLLWARTAQADLAYRCGHPDAALQQLAAVRAAHGELGDPVGVARTWLTEGDWFATPGSYPEALGFDLTTQNAPSPLAATADATRAAWCYDRAAALLDQVDAPLAHAAVALRGAAVAALRDDTDARLAWLGTASRACAEAGDAAGSHLVTIHTLLARTARGDTVAVRREAGSGWDLVARGPIAEIIGWATARGSRSWCTGLGRLCQRAGAAWQANGDLERAETAHLLAVPLLPVSGAVSPAAALVPLAQLDERRNFAARALVRLDQARAAMPSTRTDSFDARRWLERADLLMSTASVQITRGGSSHMGRGLRGLQQTSQLIDAHVDAANTVLADRSPAVGWKGEETLARLLAAQADRSLDELAADLSGSANGVPVVQAAAQALRLEAKKLRCSSTLVHARVALAGGWDAESHRLFAAALDEAERAGPELGWMPVLVQAAAGDIAAAQDRLHSLRGRNALPDDLFATLAIRVRDFPTAQQFGQWDEPGSWLDALDRAEIALGTGDPHTAVELAMAAIAAFEQQAADLRRDPDLVAYCDNISAEYLYALAARAWLDIARQSAEIGDTEAQRVARARALSVSDQGRTVTLRNVAIDGDVDAAIRRWQQLATEWSAAFDRLVAAAEATDGQREDSELAQLHDLDRQLLLAENRLGSQQRATTRPARDEALLSTLQTTLDADACLVQYHVAGRELLVFGVTADDIVADHDTLDRAIIPGLVHRLVDACQSGDPGDDADELSTLLLDPIDDILRDHRRVILVPYGPLRAVPFHALPFGDGALIDGHDISYVHAASLLDRHPIDGLVDWSSATVVGDPAFAPDAHPLLQRLPGAAVEARTVGRMLGVTEDDLLVGRRATETAVRRSLTASTVVHLAAHGRLDDLAPTTSSIVLTDTDELTVADLIGLRVDAELAVLSACDTGRGTATMGGDLIGLTRGLLAAGVKRTVASLWPVDDATACVTMELFYRNLTGDTPLPPAQALADAQRDVRKLTPSQINTHYTDLGGAADPGRRKRGQLTPPAARALRTIPLDPEFVDTDDEDLTLDANQPAPTALWAPFVLIGH